MTLVRVTEQKGADHDEKAAEDDASQRHDHTQGGQSHLHEGGRIRRSTVISYPTSTPSRTNEQPALSVALFAPCTNTVGMHISAEAGAALALERDIRASQGRQRGMDSASPSENRTAAMIRTKAANKVREWRSTL